MARRARKAGRFGGDILSAVLQQVPVGVVVAEAPSGRIILYNAEAERIWRRPLQVGENILTYRLGDVLDANGTPYAPGTLPLTRSIRTGESIREERIRVRRGDGSWAILSASSAPIRDDKGDIVAGVVAYKDVTARLLAEERAQGIVDTVDGIVWEVDIETFCFTYVSQQAVRILGYPIEDWYRPGFWESILHADDREWAVTFCLDQTQRKQAHDFEYRVRTRDGQLVWLRDIVSVIVEGDVVRSLRGIMVDVTAKKELEAERERLLTDERAAREAAEHLAVEAQRASRLRDEFLSIASHELRTPLHALQLVVQAMAHQRPDVPPIELTRSLGLAQRQVTRLVKLVTTLLDVSRIQLGRLTLELEDVELVELVHDIVGQLGEDRARSGSPVFIRGAARVHGRWDRARLEQVVVNLLTNAIKFGVGRPIDILVEEHGDMARLVVSDEGIGLSPEAVPHVFECYERDVSARNYGGLGLGLYIVRSIVDAHGGTVKAESRPGSGARFTVELPCAGPDDRGDERS